MSNYGRINYEKTREQSEWEEPMNSDFLDAVEIGAEAKRGHFTSHENEVRLVYDALFSAADSDSIALVRDGDKVKVMRLYCVSIMAGEYVLEPLAQQEER